MIGRLLCRLHFHSWVFISPNLLCTGAYEVCRRCRVVSLFLFVGVRTYDVHPDDPLLRDNVTPRLGIRT